MKTPLLALAVSAACLASAHAQAFSVRIINGTTAQPSAYPWMVSLRQGGGQFCGASLIAPNWVMTAAHCVEQESAQGMQAVIGDFDLTDTDQAEQTRGVKRIVIHPDRTGRDEDHDIALLELQRPASNAAVARASAAETDAIAAGTPLTVMGWGNRSTTGEDFPDRLHEVQVPLVSQRQCETNYGGGITGNMICAGLPQGGKDSCQGDSGGPLVFQRDGQWLQVGIVSWGEGCAVPDRPGVYARVGAYTDWIANTLSGGAGSNGGTGDMGDTGGTGQPDEPTDPDAGPDVGGGDNGDGGFPLAGDVFGLPAWLDLFAYEGEVAEASLSFVNTTDTSVVVSSATIDSPAFDVVANGCTASLAPEASCDIGVAYQPGDYGDFDTANLMITVDNGALIDVVLVGENLASLPGIGGADEGDWFADDSVWMLDADGDGYALNAWSVVDGDTGLLFAEFDGPGLLEFEWGLFGEDPENRLVYAVDGEPVRTLTGGHRTVGTHATTLSDGRHTVTWAFQKRAASTGQAKVSAPRFTPRTNVATQTQSRPTAAQPDAGTPITGGGAGGPLGTLMLLGAVALHRRRRG
ncbi:MAG: serine protease [Pseudomonadota bacterium]